MKSPIQKQEHIIKEVTLPSLTFQSKTIANNVTFGWGKVSEGSDIYFLFLY